MFDNGKKFKKVIILLQGDNSVQKFVFNDASILISGKYLIISTTLEDETTTINNVYPLDFINSFKTQEK